MWVFVMVLVSMDPKGTLYMRRGVHKQHLSQVVDITDKHGVMPAVQHTLLTLYRRDKTIQHYHSNNIHWSSVMEQPVLTQVRAQEDIFNKNHVNHSNECSFAVLTRCPALLVTPLSALRCHRTTRSTRRAERTM